MIEHFGNEHRQNLRISQKSNAGFDLARSFMKFGRFHSHIRFGTAG